MVIFLCLFLSQSYTCKLNLKSICNHRSPTSMWCFRYFDSFSLLVLTLSPTSLLSSFASESWWCGWWLLLRMWLPLSRHSPLPQTEISTGFPGSKYSGQSTGHACPALSMSELCIQPYARAECPLVHCLVPVPPMSPLVWLILLFGHTVSSLPLYIIRDWVTYNRKFIEVVHASAEK